MEPRHKRIFRTVLAVMGAVFLSGILFFTLGSTEENGASRSPFSILSRIFIPGAEKPAPPQLLDYIEVTGGCGPYMAGGCVNVRSGPGETYPSVAKLRNGIVLQSGETVSADGRTWHKITFGEWLRYPERVKGEWYVAADYVRTFRRQGAEDVGAGGSTPTKKHILVDRSDQMLYAYDGDTLFMETKVSTGLDLTPTPRGTFAVYRKTPSRYMQGPLPGISDQYYDLPGVPWNLYFTKEGGAIHGAYWHDKFGEEWSHGCVNLPLDEAKRLYEWAPLGTAVVVRD